MQVVPPLAVKRLSELEPGELVKLRLTGSIHTLALTANMEGVAGTKLHFVCLEGTEPRNPTMSAPFFLAMHGSTATVLSFGTGYSFIHDKLADATLDSETGRNNGSLLLTGTDVFLRVQGTIGGFTEECHYDVKQGTLRTPSGTDRAAWSLSSWSIRLNDHIEPPTPGLAILSFKAAR